MNNTKTQFKGVAMLMITAFVWGSSFVAQAVGMEKIQAFTFNGIRTLIGALVLFVFLSVRDRITARKMSEEQLAQRKALNRKTWKSGLILGLVFCVACNLQQYAFYYSTSGRIAFITAFYMFLVPILGLFFKKRVPIITWLCVIMGVVGMFFLCIDPKSPGNINIGDIFTLGCAFFYAVHILMIEKLAPEVDGVRLSMVQFVISGVITICLMFLFETPQISLISQRSVMLSILYSGVMSCGVAYTFQIVGQKYTEATLASIIMCLESVFGVICGAVILGDKMLPREIVGCVIMFVAIVLSQLSDKITDKLRNKKQG